MLALLLLLLALFTGTAVATLLRLPCGPWSRLAIGSALAQLLVQYVPFYFAYSFDLGVASAGICSLLTLALAAAALGLRLRRELHALFAALAAALRAPGNRPVVLSASAFMLLLAWLHHTHYLRPFADGLHSGGVTWGDLPLHTALASRFLKAEGLPVLEHPLYFRGPLIYPFLPDYSVAVLAALGLGLRGAFIAGGVFGVGSLLLLLHALTRAWLPSARALESILVQLLFLLAGGFGFVFSAARLLGGEPLLQLLRTSNATYDISPHIAKAGHIGNLFLASRCAVYGMPIGSCVLLLLHAAVSERDHRRARLLLAGIAAGALPLVHTHSFLVVVGVVCAQLLFVRQRLPLAQVALALLPIALLAAPALWLLSRGGEWSFLRIEPGFLRPAPSLPDWLLDLVLGMGLSWLLVPFALRRAAVQLRVLAAPLLLLLPLANVVAFAPAAYDNIKLIAWFDLAAAILLAGWLAPWLRRPLPARALAALALLGCTASGALALAHELLDDHVAVPAADVRFAALVEQHTPPGAVIATAASYHDPVVMLAGRPVLLAAPLMVRLNGIDVRSRARDIMQLYAGGPAALQLIERFDLYAVVIGPAERSDLPRVDVAFFAAHARARYGTDGRELYVLDRQRAR